MTPRLPVVTADDLVRVAKRAGFMLDRQKGSHGIYFRATDKARVVIPMHKGKNIKPKTLTAIIEDMGLTVKEFRALL